MDKDRAWQEIDLHAISHNIDVYKSKSPHMQVIAVVKADGYGHGAVKIAQFLENRDDVAGFAVATSDEALRLRDGGIKKKLIILGPVHKDCLRELITRDVSLSVSSIEEIGNIRCVAKEQQKTALIHIKADTGMNRLGFAPDDDSIHAISSMDLKNIFIEGIFTHFPCADEPSCDQLTQSQYLKFKEFSDKLSDALNRNDIMLHVANSAAAWRLADLDFDYVRLGISLYGLPPSDSADDLGALLKPAMSVRARIVRIHEVKKGEKVGYSGTFGAAEDSRIATIAFGYGDGYPRELSNMGYCLIRGQRAPIAGRICMDYFMADVSKITGVTVSDTATLIGRDQDNEITLMKLSNLSGRFHYEFACGLGVRANKIYL